MGKSCGTMCGCGGGDTSEGRSLSRGKILGGQTVTSLGYIDLGGLVGASEGNKDRTGGKILGGESVRSIVVSTMDKATSSSISLSLL